jgi:hypothetical protein
MIHTHPDASDANTLAGIATHTLGAAREHVLGWALGRRLTDDVDRFDDDATIPTIRDLAEAVLADMSVAFDELATMSLETLVATPGRGEQPIRSVLAWAMLHPAEHVGAAELTSGLLRASRQTLRRDR